MAEVTLTFTCGTNYALLLLAFYEIISDVPPDECVASVEHVAWLVDEIGGRAAAMVEYLELEERDVSWQLHGLGRMYEHLPRLGGAKSTEEPGR